MKQKKNSKRFQDQDREGQLSPPPNSLGPGRGPWERRSPETFGMSSAKLREAAKLLKEAVPHRYCLAVIKNGFLVHEEIFYNTSATKYRTQSAGKTMVAAMFGTLVQRGLLDLDRPLASYGVPRNATWNLTGVDYYPQVTARHLLSQASGYGRVPPGSMFTYDSYEYIQHLSSLIRNATHGEQSPTKYATQAFAEPMGFPDIFRDDSYIYDMAGEDISAGGGQMMSCLDVARVGQLLLNKGAWRGAGAERGDSKADERLLPESYVEQMLSPSFPKANMGYGFLTWLNRKPNASNTDCCAPRWSPFKRCTADDKTCALCCKARPPPHTEGGAQASGGGRQGPARPERSSAEAYAQHVFAPRTRFPDVRLSVRLVRRV